MDDPHSPFKVQCTLLCDIIRAYSLPSRKTSCCLVQRDIVQLPEEKRSLEADVKRRGLLSRNTIAPNSPHLDELKRKYRSVNMSQGPDKGAEIPWQGRCCVH